MMPPKKSKARAKRAQRVTTTTSSPRPRTHSFTGCLTCRERHVKCDLRQPACHNCLRLKVSCEGYIRKYTWVTPRISDPGRRSSVSRRSEDVEEGQSSRRVLFSDEERVAMAVRMRDECCTNSSFLDLDLVLRELQDKITDANEFLRIGPFGVFPASSCTSRPCTPVSPHLEVDITPEAEYVEQTEIVPTPDLELSLPQFTWSELGDEQTWDTMDAALVTFSRLQSNCGSVNGESPENWALALTSPSQMHVFETDIIAATDRPDLDCARYNLPTELYSSHSNRTSMFDLHTDSPLITQMPNTANMSKIPPEARLLLDYYSSQMIELMSMAPIKKPPWKTIHLPCAMGALAELLVHGEARSFAKMALFYALLSISAFHLGLGSKDSEETARYWKTKGAAHKETAQKYLRSSLNSNVPKATRGKYKEVLMSMLSMVTIGVFSGDMQDSHTYLAESESLIRNFGLPKPVKSLKISKLHHIFSYLRIIHESTSLRGGKAGHNCPDITNITQTQTTLIEELSDDSAHTTSSRLAYIEDEENEDREEDPLFVSIYQLPTTLLSLISQTSSLCKQLDSVESPTPDFARRCNIVEDRIFRWKAPADLSLPSHFGSEASNSPDATAKAVAAHLVTATYQALIVHFQRQIRNTNPRVLQHYVISAADHLLAQEQLKKSLKICHTPFPWPGFIVGCEAYDVSARQKIDLYLKTIRCYNVGSVMEAEKVVYEVWRRQDLGRSDHRWEDVLKDWGMQVVLT